MALNPQFDQLLPSVSALAREAGALAMRWFRPGARTTARVWSKEGDSPVTEADVALDRLLEDRLGALAPDIGWLSEEAERHPESGSDAPAWIVDPIDGTRAFLSGDPIWAVSIALTEGGRPRIAALYLPAVDRLYAAVAGGGAFVDGERIAPGAPAPRLVAGPRMLLDRLLTHVDGFAAHPKVPSLAARIAMVADRRLAAAIASDGAREWDLAAADLIVAEAGGRLTDLRGHAIRYDASPRRHGVLLASADADHDALMTAAGAAIAARPSS